MTEPPAGARVVQPVAADVEAVAKLISTGKCILFLGAGVHAAPPAGSRWTYDDSERPLRGGELAEYLANASDYMIQYPDEKPRNLGRISLYCEIHERYGRRWLVDEIRQKVHEGKRPSPVLRALAELGFPFIATTNYDQLMEEALREKRRAVSISIYNKSSSATTSDYVGKEIDPTAAEPFLLKIHGDINMPESMVITDEDYIDFVLRMSDKEPFNPVPMSFKHPFAKYPTLFIGYSLLDYNLRLLFKTLRWNVDKGRMPPSYAVDPYPDRMIQNMYHTKGGFVRFIVTDVWSFVPLLYKHLMEKEMP
ncbi:MAG TPA: SIR2 family protein [Thermoanaerobaculia bacterium]|nr:SIR2 family protein [Thermoanaerobaculia bacterium]